MVPGAAVTDSQDIPVLLAKPAVLAAREGCCSCGLPRSQTSSIISTLCQRAAALVLAALAVWEGGAGPAARAATLTAGAMAKVQRVPKGRPALLVLRATPGKQVPRDDWCSTNLSGETRRGGRRDTGEQDALFEGFNEPEKDHARPLVDALRALSRREVRGREEPKSHPGTGFGTAEEAEEFVKCSCSGAKS